MTSCPNVCADEDAAQMNWTLPPGHPYAGYVGWNDRRDTASALAIVEVTITKDQCKNDGWKSYDVFKNQGDCVSFVATVGKGKPTR